MCIRDRAIPAKIVPRTNIIKPNKGTKETNTSFKISDLGGNIGAIDIVRPEPDALIRDITIFTHNPEHGEKLVEGLREIEDVEFINFSDRTFLAHLQGKIEINNRLPLSTRDDLSIAYTPGVARVCTEIHKNKQNLYK